MTTEIWYSPVARKIEPSCWSRRTCSALGLGLELRLGRAELLAEAHRVAARRETVCRGKVEVVGRGGHASPHTDVEVDVDGGERREAQRHLVRVRVRVRVEG